MCARQDDRAVRTGPDPSSPSGPSAQAAGTAAAPSPAVPPQQAEARPGNAACLDCHSHRDFQNELISRVHERQSILCADCHGTSAAHRAGGDPPSAPDKVFARGEIDSFCSKCHQERHSRAMIERTVSRWEGRPRPNGRTATVDSVCTDCHGTHVLAAGR